MKKYTSLIILAAILFNTQISIGQNYQRVNINSLSDNTARVIYNRDFRVVETLIDYSTIEGTAYLDDQLVLGYVRLKNGDSLNYYMRYDMYSDEIEYLKEGSLYVISNKNILDFVSLNNEYFVYENYITNNKIIKGYLIQSYKNKISLYRKEQVVFEDKKPPQTMPYSEGNPARFNKLRTTWLFSSETKPIVAFSTDNEGLKLISGSNDQYKMLKAFIKENHLKIKKEEDLITLFRYYNSLL
jgi:hypothetical protein